MNNEYVQLAGALVLTFMAIAVIVQLFFQSVKE
jgi:hypothetical protein